MSILIKNIRAIDPRHKLDKEVDVLIEKGKIAKIGTNISAEAKERIDGKGLCLLPGLIDLHVHFREPGFELKETVETGSKAALHGGFVAAVTMPNTKPACDNRDVVEGIVKRAKEAGFQVFPCGTLTKGREGKEISEMSDLKDGGCVAVSDDGNAIENSLVSRRAMEYASMLGLLVISHSEEEALSKHGVMNESAVSTRLGLKGIPREAEDIAVFRDIEIATLAGARIHIAHISTKGAVELVKNAKKKGLPVTCEVTPHHFALTEDAVENYDTNFKMNPPLRTKEDVEAMKEGLKDRTIDIISTDHAPHMEEEKSGEFIKAPFGVVGLETSLGVALTELYQTKVLDLNGVIEKMAAGPAEILGLKNFNEIKEGSEANLTIVDLEKEWIVDTKEFKSKGKNTCFKGRKLKGKAVGTVCRGKYSV